MMTLTVEQFKAVVLILMLVVVMGCRGGELKNSLKLVRA